MPQSRIDIAPQELWPWLLIAGGAVALGVIIFLITLLVRQRDAPAHRSAHVTPAQQRTLEREVSNLIAALSEMAREVGAGLEERAVRLEKLIHAADEQVRRLEHLSDTQDSQPQMDSPPVIIAPSPPVAPIQEAEPQHAEVYALADQGLPSPEIAQRLSRPTGEVELILALRPRRAG